MKIGFTCSAFDLLHAGHTEGITRSVPANCVNVFTMQSVPSYSRKRTSFAWYQGIV